MKAYAYQRFYDQDGTEYRVYFIARDRKRVKCWNEELQQWSSIPDIPPDIKLYDPIEWKRTEVPS